MGQVLKENKKRMAMLFYADDLAKQFGLRVKFWTGFRPTRVQGNSRVVALSKGIVIVDGGRVLIVAFWSFLVVGRWRDNVNQILIEARLCMASGRVTPAVIHR